MWSMLRPAALVNLINRNAQKPLCVKTHSANCYINEIPLIPRDLTAKAIYLVRDPRDVVISYSNHMGIDIDLAIKALNQPDMVLMSPGEVPQFTLSWSKNTESWACRQYDYDVFWIRYEDLLVRPEEYFTKIIEIIFNKSPEPESFKRALEISKFDNLQKYEAEVGFREKGEKSDKFFKRGYAGYWKDILTPKQVLAIEEPNQKMMKFFNYL